MISVGVKEKNKTKTLDLDKLFNSKGCAIQSETKNPAFSFRSCLNTWLKQIALISFCKALSLQLICFKKIQSLSNAQDWFLSVFVCVCMCGPSY